MEALEHWNVLWLCLKLFFLMQGVANKTFISLGHGMFKLIYDYTRLKMSSQYGRVSWCILMDKAFKHNALSKQEEKDTYP